MPKVVDYKQSGYTPNLPIVIVPGLCSSAMQVVESPHKEWIDKRIWLDITTIGFGKVWDRVFDRKGGKKNKKLQKTQQEQHINNDTEEETQTRRKWISHMVLQKDGITDPPGIKLRAIESIEGIMYLDPGALTKSLSYVFGPFINLLWDIGYTDKNLKAAPYDWRIPPRNLELRDKYFSRLASKIEDMAKENKEKVVIIAHSLGTRCSHYFLRFVEHHYGREWVTNNVHTWIPVGPIFLGAPKSVKASVIGERMGLEAFLRKEEGLLLSRACASSAWMFPYSVPDFPNEAFVYRKAQSGYRGQDYVETFEEAKIQDINEGFKTNYHEDPLFGSQEDMLRAPPVDKLFAIYGINLKTESFYFFKKAKEGSLTELELDSSGKLRGFDCSGGVGYETKKTAQPKLLGGRRSGDGTVPYASLSYCTHWVNEIEVVIEELEGAEHREILIDKSFTKLVVKYVTHAPVPPQLPEQFEDLAFDVMEIREKRKANRTIKFTRKGIIMANSRGKTHFNKKYTSISSLEKLTNNVFSIQFSHSSTVYMFYAEELRRMQQELNVRIRFLKHSRASEQEPIDENGQTALHRAVNDDDSALVRELLSDGSNVNLQDKNGWTPLHFATFQSFNSIALLLLAHPKIEPNLITKLLESSFGFALRSEDEESREEVWQAFLDAGADINRKCQGDNTLLHNLVIEGNLESMKWLIGAFCSVNARNQKGETPLHLAVEYRKKNCIALLLDSGADKHLPNVAGDTPLDYAQKTSQTLLVFLQGYSTYGYKATAFFPFTAEYPEELSLSVGDQVNHISVKPEYGNGWWLGECHGKEGFFPSNYVKVFEEIRDKDRPMIGEPEPEDGPNDIRDDDGRTPLHRAVADGDTEKIKELLEDPLTNFNAQDSEGCTPLHCATTHGSLTNINILLDVEGINLSRRNVEGATALHYLARICPKDRPEQLQMISAVSKVKHKVALDILTSKNETPLHFAAVKNNLIAIKYLLEHNANPNAMNCNGMTPLFFAVMNKSVEAVKFFVFHGANPAVAGKRGSPLDIAKQLDHKEILNLLLNAYGLDIHVARKALELPELPSRTTRRVVAAKKKSKPKELSSRPKSEIFSADDFEAIDDSLILDPVEEALLQLAKDHFSGDMVDFQSYVTSFFDKKIIKSKAPPAPSSWAKASPSSE